MIAVATADSLGRAVVRLVDGAVVEIRVPAGAGSFTSGAGRVAVALGPGPVQLEVDIPRSALRVELWVGGRRLVAKDGSRLLVRELPWAGEPTEVPLVR